MRFFILTFFWKVLGSDVYAFTQTSHVKALSQEAVESLGLDFRLYLSDECSHGVEKSQAGQTLARICRDTTISFDQPTSTGPMGWNGFCGQTAVANTLAASCRYLAHPLEQIFPYTQDYGPGTHPQTLSFGLDAFIQDLRLPCPSPWHLRYHSSQAGFLDALRKLVYETPTQHMRIRLNGETVFVQPVIVLVSSVQSIHWLTVVDVEENSSDCRVVINQWSKQYTMPCTDFAAMAANANLWGLYLGQYLILAPM